MKQFFSCRRGELTIRGEVHRPAGEQLEAVIICHGFMANRSSVRGYAKALAEAGYAAFIFDFCGGGLLCRSGGKTTGMTVLTETEDLKAVMDFVQTQPYVRTGPVTLMGCSQGGFVSALTAASLPDRVARLVLLYPALCIPDDARRGSMIMARFDPQNIPDVFRCGPMKLGRCYPESVMDMDPMREIAPYTGPVLIVHGTKDSIVPCSYSEEAAKVYSHVHLETIEGADHGFRGADDERAVRLVKDFLAGTFTF